MRILHNVLLTLVSTKLMIPIDKAIYLVSLSQIKEI